MDRYLYRCQFSYQIHTSVPPTGCVGNIINGTITITTLVAPFSGTSVYLITLSPGVWNINAAIYYRSLSGTVSTIILYTELIQR